MNCVHIDIRKVDPTEYFHKRGIKSAYMQPKINGIRAKWYANNRVLMTRGFIEIVSVPHIVNDLIRHYPETDVEGEIFNEYVPFRIINGAVRKRHNSVTASLLDMHLFDTMEDGVDQHKRLLYLHSTDLERSKSLKLVRTYRIETDKIHDALTSQLKEGYEGIVVRNPFATYKKGRHVGNLWAIKPVYAGEAVFIKFKESSTDLHADTFGSLVLRWPVNNRLFTCSGFTEDERTRLFNGGIKQGDLVTIEYGAMSHENKAKAVPLYPRFRCVRWDL